MRHDLHFLYTKVHHDFKALPQGIKTLVFGFFVYMLAWGIIEPFFSIYLHSVVGNYALAGLFYSILFFTGFAISIPAGGLAGKINKMRYIKFSMLLYPAVGIFYFLVPMLPRIFSLLVLFLALVAHGIAASFWIMVEGFIREKSPKKETSAAFGLFITFQRLAYVIGPGFIFFFVVLLPFSFEKINWLFLSLLFFPVVSAFMVGRISDKGKPIAAGIREVVVKDGVVKKELKDLNELGFMGGFALLTGFFMRSIEIVVTFLLPLYALSLNMGLVEIALLFGLVSLPYLSSFFLAELADSFGKAKAISLGFALAAVALFFLSFSTEPSATFFITCLALGFILALLQPAVNGLITDITPRVQDGEMTGLFSAVLKISGFLTAILLGFLADFFGLAFPFAVFAIILLVMSLLTYLIRGKVVLRI